jgi:SOUL heme-binding protein
LPAADPSNAFQLLFAYIAGANRSVSGNERIAMTVPVEMRDAEHIAMTVPVETSETGATIRMRFFRRRNTRAKPPLRPWTISCGWSRSRSRRSACCASRDGRRF